MKTTVYLSRKLLNQLKVKETESKDLMLTHNLHNNRYRLYAKILSCLRSIREKL